MAASRTDRFLQLLIGLLLVALVAVFAEAVRDKVIGVGNQAPDFSIRTDAGVTVSPANFGGRVLVLNFWATWCPPCIEEMPSLDQLHQRLRDSGVIVLGVSVDEDENSYKTFLERAKVSFFTARDPEAAISARFGTYRYPETYVIDAQGKVVQKIVGPTDWTDERMMSYIKSIL
jgi:peroxiredoxin